MDAAFWTLSLVFVLVGLAGSFVPLLPGTTFILAGALLQKWLLPGTLSWLALGLIAAVWLISVVADVVCTLASTRLAGGSRWGLAGATAGAFIGVFFSLRALVLGIIAGAVLAEVLFAKRPLGDALRAGAGAALGFGFALVVRAGCAVTMTAAYVAFVAHAVGAAV